MNTVGKIFVVLIFIMSLVVMSFIMAVYMTHTNWRDKAIALQDTLKTEKAITADLQQRLDTLTVEADEERQLAQTTRGQLESQVETLTNERDTYQDEVKTLRTNSAEAVAVMKSSQATLVQLRSEVDDLRDEKLAAQKERDTVFNEIVSLTDEMNALQNQFNDLKAREVTLAADYANALEVLRLHDLKDEPALYTGVPPRVYAEVLAVRSAGLIEISIGEDDGIARGHRLEVYRMSNGQSMYLGRVEVSQVTPDKAVCKILPEFRQGTIQRGDSVASKLE